MQRMHIIHVYIALHKFDKRVYSPPIGSEMIQPANHGAALSKATEEREGELVERPA